MEKRGVCLLVLLLFVYTSSGQYIDQKIRFFQLTTQDGLASNQINQCLQDSRGFIWIVSNGGVNRYDGNQCKTYTYQTNDSTQLPTPLIKCVAEDKNGDMWFGTLDKGIVRFDVEQETYDFINSTTSGSKLEDNVIVKMICDHRGDVWYATEKGSYGKIKVEKGGQKKFWVDNYGANDNKSKLDVIFEDSKHRIWLGMPGGFFLLENDEKSRTPKLVFKANGGYFVTESPTGELFLLDRNQKLFWAREKQRDVFDFVRFNMDSAYWAQKYVDQFSFVFSSATSLVAGRPFEGFFTAELDFAKRRVKLRKPYRKDILDPTAIGGNSVKDIMIDKTGVVWISTRDGGVFYFDLYQKQFSHIRQGVQQGDLQKSDVLQMHEDRYETLWLTVRGGNPHYLPRDKTNRTTYGNFQTVDQGNGISNPFLVTLFESFTGQQSSLWMGSWNTFQLKDYKPNSSWDKYFTNHNLGDSANQIPKGLYFSMAQDSSGRMWYGSYTKGLCSFYLDENQNITQLQRYTHKPNIPSSIASNTIRAIKQTRDGNIWIGTSQGLNKLLEQKGKPISFKRYQNNPTDTNSLSHDYLMSIFEDKAGTMWLGSFGGGLIKVIRDSQGQIRSFRGYTDKDGLPSKIVKGILEDDHGNLWISTSKGLCKFNPQKEQFKTYTKDDGLQSDDFSDNSCVKRKNGHMLFGGANGFNVFFPDSIKDNPFLPQIAITDFKVYGKSVKANQQINGHAVLRKSILKSDSVVITHHENVIEFNFAALHFASAQRNKLKYKLRGFDENWVEVPSDRRFASYTNLDGGTYTFMVMGANNDGLWNPKPQTITLVVLPPWWKTTWFRILATVLILSSFIAFYLYRMRAIRKENEQLEKLVDERTEKLHMANVELQERQEEVLTQNEEISQQAEELKATNERLEEQKNTIQDSYESIKRLGEFGQEVTSVLNTHEISEMVSKYVGHFMQTDVHGIGLFASKKKHLIFRSFNKGGQEQDVFSCGVDKRNSLVALCLLQKKEILSGNLKKDFAGLEACADELAAETNEISAIYIPIWQNEKPIGVLLAQRFRLDAFNEQQFNLLRNLASYLTIAIANAKSYQLIKQKNTDINNSIHYAQTIQQAILPLNERIGQYFEHFTIFKPKDLVSGDFYWFTAIERDKQPDLLLFAVIDCTGHGVPGAIMSIVSNGALTRIVKERNITAPAQVLESLDLEIRKMLKQDRTDNKDGMDVCLCSFTTLDNGDRELCFAASKRPLFVYRHAQDKLDIYKGTRRYIGGIQAKKTVPFSAQTFRLEANDVVYLSSDGYADQNSPARERFGSPRLAKLLAQIAHKPLSRQEKILEDEFAKHKGDEDQRDDVTLVGLKI